jgi:hydrogenase nickel incorporation protein HypA/HybF
MYELGLCEAILDVVEKRAGDRPVAPVPVRVGQLHHVYPEAFEQSFALVAAGRVADSAAAELVLIPVIGRCLSCSSVFDSADPIIGCPACGSLKVQRSGGDELTSESIEYRS